MTASIINLRRARKAKARALKEQQAEESRRLHGRSRAERQGDAARAELEARRIEGHRLTPAVSATTEPDRSRSTETDEPQG